MLVEIWGPNLPKSKHGETFHVHTKGCADTKRGIYRQVPPPWEIDAKNINEIIMDIYPPDDFDYDPDNSDEYSQYDQDVYVFPCVTL